MLSLVSGADNVSPASLEMVIPVFLERQWREIFKMYVLLLSDRKFLAFIARSCKEMSCGI